MVLKTGLFLPDVGLNLPCLPDPALPRARP
jgi:hypothetical protein